LNLSESWLLAKAVTAFAMAVIVESQQNMLPLFREPQSLQLWELWLPFCLPGAASHQLSNDPTLQLLP